MRSYQPIWEKIKADGKCTISCATVHAKRLKKAVIKEKYMDTDYNLHNNSEFIIKIKKTANPLESYVEFTLKTYPKALSGED